MRKKTKKQVLVGLIILAGLLIFLSSQGIIDLNPLNLIGYESVYKAFYGHICCEEGAYEPKYIRYADDVKSYSCNAYTDECRIEIEVINPPLWNLNRIVVEYDVCNFDGSNCKNYDYIATDGDIKTISIDYGQKVNWINSARLGWDARSYFQFSADYRKFYIQGVENGKVFVAKSCILNSELKNRVLAGGLNELDKTGINRCQNYITDYVEVVTKTYSYSGDKVICQARNIYEIDNINLLDGSSKKIQGELIKGVECCPQEANCDENTFKFKEVVIKECDYNYQCANAGEPVAITGTSYVNFNCVNNKCQQSTPTNVECTNNAICVNKLNKPNAVCKDFKCEIDDSWLGHCGDNKCESILGETPTSCPADCGEYPRVSDCSSCDEFALSKLVGSFWKEKECKPKLIALPPQTTTTCIFSFIKLLLIPIVLIFSTLFGINFFQSNKLLRIRNKGLSILISLILAGLLAYFVYIAFWIGLIIFGIYIVLIFIIKFIKPF